MGIFRPTAIKERVTDVTPDFIKSLGFVLCCWMWTILWPLTLPTSRFPVRWNGPGR